MTPEQIEFYKRTYEDESDVWEDPEGTFFDIKALISAVEEFAARSTPKQGEAPKVCGVCFEDEAFTGTCGGGRENPRALCFQGAPSPSVEPAPWGESPTYDQLISELAACRDAIGDREGVIDECMQAVGDPLSVAAFVRAYVALQSASPPLQVEPGWVSDAARDVLAERARQISVEGWTPEHDDEHNEGALAQAGACYARWAFEGRQMPNWVPTDWPWADEWWKAGDPRRNLIKATSLILAEVERFDRATATKESRP